MFGENRIMGGSGGLARAIQPPNNFESEGVIITLALVLLCNNISFHEPVPLACALWERVSLDSLSSEAFRTEWTTF